MNSGLSFGQVLPEAWATLVQASRQGTPFNRLDFLETLGGSFQFWGVFDGTTLMAACGIQVDGSGKPMNPAETFNFYNGILLSPAITGLPSHSRIRRELAVMEHLIGGICENYSEVWLCTNPHLEDIRAIQWFNYHAPEKGQFRIDLRYTGLFDMRIVDKKEALITSLARGRQSDYKKSLNKGVTVASSSDVPLLNDLHFKTFQRQGADRGSLERLLPAIVSSAINNGYGELLVAYLPDGTPISATVLIWDHGTAYYLFGATDPEFRGTGAATFVLAESMWRVRERGMAVIDFVGINSPQRGEYKTSFGAVPSPYFELYWRRP